MTGDFCIAVHALVYLNHKRSVVSSEMLAENICTNSARIRKVMSKLKKSGFVEAQEGHIGGYYIIRPPETLSLKEVLDALDEPAAALSWHSGSMDMECLISSGMAGVMDDIISGMNEVSREYLNTITIDIIDKRIFNNEE